MIDKIISWAVPFVLGGAVSLLTACFVFFRAIRSGVQCLLRAEIIRNHEKYMARKHCPIYAKEALKRAYKAYHALGGNDVATRLYEEVMELPTE